MRLIRPRNRTWRRRLSIAAYLSLGFGGLTFVAVGSVLLITLYANWRNTSELLADKSRLILSSLTGQIELWLDPTVGSAEFVATMIESGRLAPEDHDRLLEVLAAVHAGSPQIHAVVYVDATGWMAVATRHSDGVRKEIRSWQNNPLVGRAIREARARESTEAYWEAPVFIEQSGTNLNLRRPIRRQGEFLGMAVSTIRIADMSTFIADLETEIGQNAFVLYDHDYVLAHRALEFDFPGLSRDRPLPRIGEIGDPVLFEMWQDGWQERRLIAGSGHFGRVAGRDYIYLYQPLLRYADAPWLVGSYFVEEAIATQYRRLINAALVGLLGLVAAVIAAFALGRTLRPPIASLAAAAAALRELDLDRVPALPRSRIRELDDAAGAFNTMVAGLRAFALYVPRNLVLALIARGDVTALPSETREVTVMFTDIVDFAARTEQLGAEATATFLNRHFALVTACIEAEAGTVDKYIGDAVMALWGAVDAEPGHGLRAIRAARAIAAAMRRDNLGRDQPVRLRIGVHSGPVVVGNIGTATRMNYTVVGDTVNLAQRIEALAKELLPDADVAIVISAAAAAGLPDDIPLTSLGRHRLRGLDAPTELFALRA